MSNRKSKAFNLTLTDQLICLLINKILILRIVFDLRALKGNLLSSKTSQFHVYVVEEQKQALVPSMLEPFPDLKKHFGQTFSGVTTMWYMRLVIIKEKVCCSPTFR